MRIFINQIGIILLTLPLVMCSTSNRCVQEYSATLVNTTHPPEHLYRNSLFVEVDSVRINDDGCMYEVFTFIPLNDSTISHKGLMTLDRDIIYLQMTDIETGKFPFIKLSGYLGKEEEIKINYRDGTVRKKYTLENIVTTNDKTEVLVFRFHEFFYVFFDNNTIPDDKLDVVFFATKEHGLIGSYISGYEDNEKIMISPAGEILADYIDYTEYSMRLIQ
jgi:hypothetical protein